MTTCSAKTGKIIMHETPLCLLTAIIQILLEKALAVIKIYDSQIDDDGENNVRKNRWKVIRVIIRNIA